MPQDIQRTRVRPIPLIPLLLHLSRLRILSLPLLLPHLLSLPHLLLIPPLLLLPCIFPLSILSLIVIPLIPVFPLNPPLIHRSSLVSQHLLDGQHRRPQQWRVPVLHQHGAQLFPRLVRQEHPLPAPCLRQGAPRLSSSLLLLVLPISLCRTVVAASIASGDYCSVTALTNRHLLITSHHSHHHSSPSHHLSSL